MKFVKIFLLLFVGILGGLNVASADDANWVKTYATVKNVQKVENNKYKYDLEYNIETSDVLMEDDKYVPNPVTQTISNLDKRPVEGQKVEIRYMKNMPETFEIIGKLKY